MHAGKLKNKFAIILLLALLLIQGSFAYSNDVQTCRNICDASASEADLPSCYSSCTQQTQTGTYDSNQIKSELKTFIAQLKQKGQYSEFLTCRDICNGLYGSSLEYNEPSKYNLCVSICYDLLQSEQQEEPKTANTPKSTEDKCKNINCPERICRDNVLYYDGFCKQETGECNYYKTQCDFGCDEDGKNCKNAPKSEVQVISVSKQKLILNGMDQIFIKAKATMKNEKGIIVPYPNYEIPNTASLVISGKEYPLSVLGIELKNSLIKTDSNGEMQVIIKSSSKIGQDFFKAAEKSKAVVKIADSAVELFFVTPGPKIISIGSPKGHIWQDSYGIIKVIVSDPDNNVKEYSVKSGYGFLRNQKGEDIEGEAVYASDSNNFEFGWKAPKLTQQISIDFAKKFRERFKEAASEFIKGEIDAKIESYVETIQDETVRTYSPSSLEDVQDIAEGVTKPRAIDQSGFAAKYYVAKNPKTKGYAEKYDALVEAYDSFNEIKEEVAEQASELGEAYEEGGSFFEYASRAGVIAINGYEIHSGVYSLKDKLAGKEDEENFASRAKEAAKDLTIGTMKDGLKTVADTYKVARAKKISMPCLMKIEVIDADGYTDTKGYLVEVQGYERLME